MTYFLRYIFIINPCLGNKIPNKIEDRISDICRQSGLKYQIFFAADKADVSEYAERILNEAGDEDCRFFACGGDGTFSNMLKYIHSRPGVEAGFIPYGTGNDFIRNFGEAEYFRNIKAQINGTSTPIDIATVNDRICANITNIGFDAAVTATANDLKKRRIFTNAFCYTMGVVLNFFKRPTCRMSVSCDGEPAENKHLLLAAIGNGKYYGGGYKPCCMAEPDDGLLDFAIIPVVGRFRFLSLVKSYKQGTYLNTSFGRGRNLYRKIKTVRFHSDIPVSVCVDGDVEEASYVNISVLHNAVRFILPEGISYPPAHNGEAQKETCSVTV